MKTRNIVLLVSLFFIAGSAAAQTRFYDQTRTFRENGFTYQADLMSCGFVLLYNKDAGRFTAPAIQQTHRDGRGISAVDREKYAVVEEGIFPIMNLVEQIVRNGFSATERSRLIRGERINLHLIICPDTGSIKEVHFRFRANSGYATIPVTTYRQIELELKRQVRFTPTDFGRSLNFIFRGWSIDVRVPQLIL